MRAERPEFRASRPCWPASARVPPDAPDGSGGDGGDAGWGSSVGSGAREVPVDVKGCGWPDDGAKLHWRVTAGAAPARLSEHARQQLCPGSPACRDGRRHECEAEAGLGRRRWPRRHDAAAQVGSGCEDAVVQHGVRPRGWDEGGQASTKSARVNSRDVVPSCQGVFSVRRTRPSGSRSRRSDARGGRATYRHSRSRPSRSLNPTAVPPCRLKPSQAAHRGGSRTSRPRKVCTRRTRRRPRAARPAREAACTRRCASSGSSGSSSSSMPCSASQVSPASAMRSTRSSMCSAVGGSSGTNRGSPLSRV